MIPVPCVLCEGGGKLLRTINGLPAVVTCPRCHGRGNDPIKKEKKEAQGGKPPKGER